MKDMLGREKVITADEALAKMLASLGGVRTSKTRLKIEDSLGMVSAEDVFSGEDLPSFSRSTVDGYAVSASDTYGAAETMPAYLNLGREIYMGSSADFSLAKGTASKIPTGGMLPEDADAVVMFEHVQIVDSTMIEVLKPVASGENVISAGEDIRKGELLIPQGGRIRPSHIGALAGIGITEITLYRRPVVSIISTGDEIVPADQMLSPGSIRDSNSYVIAGMVSEAGGTPARKGIFRDDYDTIRAAVEEAIENSDAIAVSGGTSVGTKDMIARIIQDIGNPGILFHGLALKPGKPMIGGVMNGIPIFGLPGHPAAVSVCLELFMRPVLGLLSGLKPSAASRLRGVLSARLSKNIPSSQGREEHVRVMVEERDGELVAVPILGKSGLLKTLVRADGLVVVPLSLNGIEKDSIVEVRLV